MALIPKWLRVSQAKLRQLASKASRYVLLLAAAIFGFLFPHFLRRFGYDPAIAGSVVITTFTDIIGFVSFLGIVSFLIA